VVVQNRGARWYDQAMGELIRLDDHRPSGWTEVFQHDVDGTKLRIYIDTDTGEMEIFQLGHDGKSCRSVIDRTGAAAAVKSITSCYDYSSKCR
jgi:hypothetical protein